MATSILYDIKAWRVGLRNRILADGRFRRWATRFPLTRPVARARAREAFALVAGFTYSQVLAAAVECGLLDVLAEASVDVATVADRCVLPEAAARRLLRAAGALGLAESVGDDRYMLGRVGAAIRADPGVIAMVRHHGALYADLADPVALLRSGGGGGALSRFWPYAEGRAGEAGSYSSLMAASQPMVAEQAIGAYDFSQHRRLLDVGGGQGAFVAAVGRAVPQLARAVFDLPEVVTRIDDPVVERFGGSFLHDQLPTGFDAITLVRILHDHDDAPMLQILRAARQALPPRGKLIVVEPMAGVRGEAAMADAYFGMYLLAMGSGRARTPAELRSALESVGFRSVRRYPTDLPLVAQVIVATT